MKFEELIESINVVHKELQQKALSAINKYLTIRNWLIGYYIVEFEQKGEDRAKYGDNLIGKISTELKNKTFSDRTLRLFRQFYLTYPKISQSVIAKLNQENLPNQIRQSVIAKFKSDEKVIGVGSEEVLNNLSFTHLVELIKIDDKIAKRENK